MFKVVSYQILIMELFFYLNIFSLSCIYSILINKLSIFLKLNLGHFVHLPYLKLKKKIVTWLTRHTNATKSTGIVETAAVILAGMGLAFVDIGLTARSREALWAVAHKWAGRVDAQSVVLTRWALLALVYVFRTVDALEAGGAGARKGTIDGAGVANGVRVTRIWGARVVQVTQEARFAGRTATMKAADTIYACSAVKARRIDAIVNVDGAIGTGPAIDTNTRVAAVRIGTRGAILTNWRSKQNSVIRTSS